MARLAVAVGAAEALEFIHSHDYIHRDFKAGNVLLDKVMVTSSNSSSRSSACSVITQAWALGTLHLPAHTPFECARGLLNLG